MFVFLSKFLPPFIYPLGILLILLILALIVHRRPRLQNGLIVTAIILLLLASNRWVSFQFAKSLEWQYLPLNPVPQADAIVLLGGGTESYQYPRPMVEVNSAGDRVLYAAYLYKQGKAPYILLSGGNITWFNGRTTTPAQDMEMLLTMMDVPESALWLQPKSQNTAEDALYSSQMLKEKGIKRILLVTSAQHMPRSVALFKHQGIEVIPAPVDYGTTDAGWENLTSLDLPTLLTNLLPSASSLSQTTNVLKEYIGIFTYRLQGWL